MKKVIRMNNGHWEIHEIDGYQAFVHVMEFATKVLYMNQLGEQVIGVVVLKNGNPFTSPVEEIEEHFREEVMKHEINN